MKAKDQFQIICFENNNAAFFADTVVLVEGDSDYLLMPHVARTLNPLWDVARTPVLFVRITGKGNIRRYRQFFRRFDIRVSVIADLDVILSGFDHVSPTVPMTEARDRLLRRVDLLIGNEGKEPTSKNAKDAHESGDLKKLWGEVRSATELLVKGEGTQQQLNEAVENFYGWQRKSDRLAVLKSNQDSEMIELRDQLLGLLRVNDVYVWSKGAIEDYYPSNVSGSDKPSFALDFCAKMVTRDALLACCGELKHRANEKETSEKEFDLVFRGIFEAAVDALKPSAQPVS